MYFCVCVGRKTRAGKRSEEEEEFLREVWGMETVMERRQRGTYPVRKGTRQRREGSRKGQRGREIRTTGRDDMCAKDDGHGSVSWDNPAFVC